MQIATTRFGDITVSDQKIIHFDEGLPGLEDFRKFALLSTADTEPFHWLQSLDKPDVSLAVINPYRLFSDYKPMIAEDVFAQLGVEETEDVLVLTVAVIPQDFKKMTTNLLAPILINTKNNTGRQVILENGDYNLRQSIYNEIREIVCEGGTPDAGTDSQA
ncbi:MAG: flagellar assembly protein FliW [Oscillospiraceae bacterium]|jgi:flagellar assembly factor FliW|nr:flagellar assembly protein FliW [Oscillospiraceae bacterium]